MRRPACLLFDQTGLINPAGLTYIEKYLDNDTIVLFGDGSELAMDHIRAFSDDSLLSLPQIKRVGLGRIPKYELRVLGQDGTLSNPHYVYDELTKDKWFCSKVAAPHLDIYLSDITSQSETQVRLDPSQTESVCYMAHALWRLLLIAEDRLGFPAVVIDRMTRHTYQLTPGSIDIDLLRKQTCLTTLDYNPDTDLLSVSVMDDIFEVKLSVLNAVYSELILPFFNSIYGRRYRVSVSLIGNSGQLSDHKDMTYGDLGRIIEGMKIYVKEQRICNIAPMTAKDLFSFVKKVKLNDESCIWVAQGATLATTVSEHWDELLYLNRNKFTADERDLIPVKEHN